MGLLRMGGSRAAEQSSGGATKLRLYPYNEEWERMRTGICNLFHVRLALHPASLLYGKA